MTMLYLMDNSVVQRLHLPTVKSAWLQALESGEIATCLPTALEAGFSARSAGEHAEILRFERGAAKRFLPPTPEIVEIAFALQSRLFAIGKGRSVGVSDLQIAATALHYSSSSSEQVTVVHYDADFDHVAEVSRDIRSQWIVPRDSVP